MFGEAAKIKEKPLRSIDEIRYNASMLLSNGHPALGEPTRLPQNIKYIGGYHIDFESIPLPDVSISSAFRNFCRFLESTEIYKMICVVYNLLSATNLWTFFIFITGWP